MDEDQLPTEQSGQDSDPEEAPQVFAVSKEANAIKFTRRDFLQVATAAAAAVALSSCGPESQPSTRNPLPPTEAATETATRAATKTATPPPTMTSTPTLTSTPTPMPQAIVKSSAQVRFGPGVDTRVVGGVAARDQVTVLGRNEDGSWLRIQQQGGVDGWIKATLVDLTLGLVNDLPIVTPMPTATPLPGKPGKTGPGQSGRDYSFTDEFGTIYHYTLPCGAPIPAGAVCACDCVTIPAGCSCDKYKGHYWYPN